MTKKIQAIETSYNNFLFRSRTEAKWAFFFDYLQIPYAYELEGYQMGEVKYLPDFHLDFGLTLHHIDDVFLKKLYIEIKPDKELEKNDRRKIEKFVEDGNNDLLLIQGQPDINIKMTLIRYQDRSGIDEVAVRWIEFEGGEIGLIPIEFLNDDRLLSQTSSPHLLHALNKARKERFESPQINARLNVCQTCGKSFKPYNPNHPDCYNCYSKKQQTKQIEAAPKPQTKECKTCGKSFIPMEHYHEECNECYFKEPQEATQKTAATESIQDQVQSQTVVHIPTVVAPAPNPDEQKKRPSFQIEKPRKSRSIKRKFVMGCALPIAAIVCVSTLVFGLMANQVGNAFLGAEPTVTSTAVPATATIELETAVCSCTQNTYDCADFSTQAEAQACFDSCFETAGDIHFLDSNEDNFACESLE